MERTIFTTEIRNGKLYICDMSKLWNEPKWCLSLWFVRECDIKEMNFLRVFKQSTAYFVECLGREVAVNPVNSGVADIIEFIDINPPTWQKGYWEWKNGEWVRKLKKSKK
jgi:hypothetical protein